MENKMRAISVLLIGVFLFGCLLPVYAATDKVNINTATKERLMSLNQIGEEKADKIIEYRKKHPFQSPEDIMKVKGVGKKIFDKNKDRIVVKDES